MKGIKIENYSNYWIFPELGMVWSNPRTDAKGHKRKGKWIGSKDKNDGYWRVGLTDDEGNPKNFLLHRLIWMSVYGEIPEELQVNHIDEDKSNNCISNLNLMTCKENNNWGTHKERSYAKQHKKAVEMCDLDGNVLEKFASLNEASRQTSFRMSHISACCKNEYCKTKNIYKDFIWRYAV